MGYRLPFFPMYAAETLADGRFQGWNLEERGAWMTLLCYAWNDESIPAAHSELARLLHVDAGDMARVWSAIGDRFAPHPTQPGRLVSPRLEEERDHAESLGRKRSDAGRKGANGRWGQENQQNGNRMRLPKRPHSEGNGPAIAKRCPGPSPSPSPEQIPPTARVTRLPTRQEAFAAEHPRTAALLAVLAETETPGAWARDGETRRLVEAAIGGQDVVEVASRVAASIKANGKPWLGFHIGALKPPSGQPKRDDRSWQERLTADEFQQAHRELASLHPDLVDAPLGCVGDPAVHPVEEIAALNARWRAVAEARTS